MSITDELGGTEEASDRISILENQCRILALRQESLEESWSHFTRNRHIGGTDESFYVPPVSSVVPLDDLVLKTKDKLRELQHRCTERYFPASDTTEVVTFSELQALLTLILKVSKGESVD